VSTDERTLQRFARAWAAAAERALPPLNLERGATHLLDALQRRKKSPLFQLRFVLAAAAILLCTATAGWRLFFDKRALELTVDGKQATTADRFGGAEPHLVRFSDGSTISLEPSSTLEVTEVDQHRVGVTMRHGAATFDVVHDRESTWEIDAGPFRVRVLGTAFRVEWQAQAQRLSVGVTRGAVRVSGPLLGTERVISAGVTCTVDLITGQAAFGTDARAAGRPEVEPEREPNSDIEARPAPSAADDRAPTAPSGSPPRVTPAPPSAVDWRDLERQGQFDKAIKEATLIGVDHIYEAASAEDLMGLARAARLAGRLDISKAALLSCRRRFTGTRDAAMAAYLLGRNAAPVEATRWFSTYLAEQPNGSLAREASGRLIEAQFASGQKEAARAQAQAYLLRYPAGPHADFAKKVLGQ
jgi:transmembrane sensor